MSLRETRHITFYIKGERHMVPAYSQIENIKGMVKVKFVFLDKNQITDIDHVIADNAAGYVKMITSKGNPFNTGALFDQLFVWFDYIIKMQ
ncbi:hypothetical protein [Mucilaginibacter glaciei]|uniref:Uncharacterized protein n=1 Tax=Mucilaginibacter glaciei TaxID=2772109 RepID=A0A926S1R7_9SPHI|nr:hypothetical protein [Mucilaginibacter glaciei]MBD1393353.1 hypothetical protein [Mucilaginibacter glaciei]